MLKFSNRFGRTTHPRNDARPRQKAKLAFTFPVTFGVASVRPKRTPASMQMSFLSRPRALSLIDDGADPVLLKINAW